MHLRCTAAVPLPPSRQLFGLLFACLPRRLIGAAGGLRSGAWASPCRRPPLPLAGPHESPGREARTFG